MNRFVMVAVASIALAVFPAVVRADDVELKAAGPNDKALQTVLRYTGDDVGKALAGGNKLKDTKKLNELVKVDAKDPTMGTLQWRGFELKRGGQTVQIPNTNLGEGVEVRLKRKDKDATDWELTEDSVKLVQKTIAECQ
jgi:hypothetical protein